MSSDGGRKLTEESEGPREGSRAAPRRRLSRGAEAEDRAAGRNGSGRAAPESGGPDTRDTEDGGTPRAAGHRGRRDTEGGGTPRAAGHRGRRDTEDGGTPRTAGHRGRRDTEDGGTPRTAGHRGRRDTEDGAAVVKPNVHRMERSRVPSPLCSGDPGEAGGPTLSPPRTYPVQWLRHRYRDRRRQCPGPHRRSRDSQETPSRDSNPQTRRS
ncbi:uncharacterized protein FLJ40521-like isoform X3 [Prionailurus viverrinus]|uniref:uncharacterized protein FLJ40521-like isoform X3 n=1 Tax=Prionailurus viverrinus TaxID=61388 RepID=UPI001FF55711|nr:uncharacterized protein FLJ40521-like isoform X3 [Prionailurus viverrinus]